MAHALAATQTRVGIFETVEQADLAVRRLLADGFTQDQLAVICPAKFRHHFLPGAPEAQAPGSDAGSAIAVGGAMGATLGGLALAATVLTGGAAGVVAAGVLIFGGALAGGFSNLMISKGYEQEADDFYKQASERGQIVIGVEVHGEKGEGQLANAQRILDEAGAKPLFPV